MDYKILILSAGLGSRLGKSYKNLNKALVSINNKPVISYLIEKFPFDIEIVVALGHKGDILRDYIEISHPKHKFKFVYVDKYFGKGSGLGYSLLACKEYLQCPFIFSPNDCIVSNEIPIPDYNWLGFSDSELNNEYRSLKINNNFVEKILEKEEIVSPFQKPYIGLAGIKDHKLFWEFMEKGKEYGSISIGECYAIGKCLEIQKSFKAIKFDWFDTGNLNSLQVAKDQFFSLNSPQILDKPNEAIWFVSGKAIKFNQDADFISNRVKRSKKLKGFVPEIVEKRKNMYSYELITGKTISDVTNEVIFEKLLVYLKDFWREFKLNGNEKDEFNKKCYKFYRIKTIDRIKVFFNKYSENDNDEIINGINVPKISEILKLVDWNWLSKGKPCRFHGDLHFENILLTESGKFCLIDWRQDFEGLYDYGDLYYDLAKLMHGFIISHEIINKEQYYFEKTEEIINFGFYRKNSLVENENHFLEFLETNRLDVIKVKILTSLVFLNIAALHHDPYSKLLFYLGKYNLFQLLKS